MKRIFVCLLLLSMLLGVAGCYVEKEEKTDLSFTFTVIHEDGTEAKFNITTEQTTLGAALKEEKLVVESEESSGLYDTVDGETADWSDGEAWWCFYLGEDSLTVGIDEQKLAEGEEYRAVFTRGF